MRAQFVLSVCLLLTAAACSNAPERRTFTLQGQVQSLDAPRKLVVVKHEEIKGFMPAMTMPYEVEEAKALDSLAPGDLINAQLVVFSNGAHLSNIKKVGTAPLEKPPADVPNPMSRLALYTAAATMAAACPARRMRKMPPGIAATKATACIQPRQLGRWAKGVGSGIPIARCYGPTAAFRSRAERAWRRPR